MKNIAVIGAGTMGNGIAHVFAQNDFKVILVDISTDQLEQAIGKIEKNLDRQINKGALTEKDKSNTLSNISTSNDIASSMKDIDLVIEAATENETIKMEIFKTLDKACPVDCILASNTSSISITKIASVTSRPGNVIGMHFMNPVPIMKLVEIINGYGTSKKVSQAIVSLTEKLNKVPVVVNDYPGFVANRILMPMINEAIYTLHEGVAGVAEIDTVMKLGMSHPMGPLQLADFIGLDVCLSILKVLHEGFGLSKYAPCPLLVNMVLAKKLGVKTSVGFYDYKAGIKAPSVSPEFS